MVVVITCNKPRHHEQTSWLPEDDYTFYPSIYTKLETCPSCRGKATTVAFLRSELHLPEFMMVFPEKPPRTNPYVGQSRRHSVKVDDEFQAILSSRSEKRIVRTYGYIASPDSCQIVPDPPNHHPLHATVIILYSMSICHPPLRLARIDHGSRFQS